MITFNMMVGLPYSGKSYFVNKYKAENDIYISSDDIRKELYGDESDQTNPNKVFDIMYKRTCKALSENKSVWYDATNSELLITLVVSSSPSNITNSDYALLIIAWLINNHMKFYINSISNWINKYNIPQSLIDKLEIVHKYDMEAH